MPPAHITPLMAAAAQYGIYKYWGKSYVVEPVRLQGSGPGMTALAAGEIELAAQGAQTLTLLVTEAKLDVRAIAVQVSSGVPGYAATGFWVREGEINTIDDLRGKVLGVNARGSTPDSIYRLMLGKKGWKEGTDYQIAEVRFAAQLAALEQKRIDVAFLVQPFDLMAREGPAATTCCSPPPTCWARPRPWSMSARPIGSPRTAPRIVDFLEDHMRMRQVDDLDRSQIRAQVLKVTSELTKQPSSSSRSGSTPTKTSTARSTSRSTWRGCRRTSTTSKRSACYSSTIEVKNYVDMSLAEEAGKRMTGM